MSPARKSRRSAHSSRLQTPYESFPNFSQLPPELRMKIWEYNLPSCRFVSMRCGYRSEVTLQQPPSPPSPPSLSHSSKSRQKSSKKTASSSSSSSSASPSSSSSSSSSSSPSSSTAPSPPTHKQTSTAGLCSSSAPIPANLHVCRESRLEALRHYAPMFGVARQPGRIYFDPDDDFLYFGPRDGYMAADAQLRTMLVLADQDELAAVGRVALHESVFGDALIDTSFPSSSSSSAADRVATNLAVDVLHELRMRLPNLRELVIVPRSHKSLVDGASSTLVPLHLPSADIPYASTGGSYDDYEQYDGDYEEYEAHELHEVFEEEYVDDYYGYDGAVMVYHDSPNTKTSRRQRAKVTAADIAAATAETDRLSSQVLEAMRRVCESDPGWLSPRWCILAAMGGGNTSSRSKHGRPKHSSHPSCPPAPLLRSTHLPRR